ncbi:hypothetical protein QZH41_005496 [Actinostola sp. cb2023]|nr:hypothetical protein QZH41_005496 [Actinostola sp. cb2023]
MEQNVDSTVRRKQYYKNLAKKHKKRWLTRKRERERAATKERRQKECEERRHHEQTNAELMEVEESVVVHNLNQTANKGTEEAAKALNKKKDEPPISKRKTAILHGHVKEIDVSGLVKIGKSIGAGTFGQCNLAKYRGMVVAVKEFSSRGVDHKKLKQEVVNEANIISLLGDHPNLPLIYGDT